MSVREKGRKKIKQETSTQYKVTDLISMADLEHIHLRKGRSYPSKPPSLSTKTWEEVRREKEERILRARRERALSTPLETTSTDAMDTEEAQEISKEIAEKATEKEIRKQKYAQYQRTKQTADYKVPKTYPIPVPDLTKPKQKKECWPPSALSNFDLPQYEEISGYGNKWQLGMWSASATPRLSAKRSQVEKAKPRIPSGNITAFQDYMPAMMSSLDNLWKPLNKGTTTPSWTTVPPLVILSTPGTPISRPQTGEELEEEQIRMNLSTVDKTVLIPEGRKGAESAASPIEFTKELQNGAALKVKPQGQSLLQTLGFEAQDRGAPDPDFYMPDGQGKRLSESYQMYTTKRTPEDKPGVLVKLPNLEKKYGTSMFLMDKKSGHLYIASVKTVKTVHDPTNRRDGQPISNSRPGVVVGVGQSVEEKIPLGGIRQLMLRMSREKRLNIPPGRMGRPNGDDNGTSDRNGDSHDYGNSPNENGGPGENGDSPDRRGGRPPRKNGNPDGEDGGSDPDDSGDGDDSSSSTDSTPPRRRGHRKPKYVYVLQGPPGPPGQEGQPGQPGQEMAEMDKHCH